VSPVIEAAPSLASGPAADDFRDIDFGGDDIPF
jgi:hypothetical protein